MRSIGRWAAGTAFMLLAAVPRAQVLSDQQAAGGQVRVEDQGSTITPAAAPHFAAALRAAGSDFYGGLLLCNQARPPALRWVLPSYDELQSIGGVAGVPPEPTRVFDNLYYFGTKGVSAWAVATSAGIVMIDSLDNGAEIKSIVEPAMRRFGLDPAKIKYVVVTHGHGDHFGGAAYIRKTYGARVLMSDADWALAPTMLDKPYFDPPPPRDLTITDRRRLTLGGETLRLYLTPGHTRGTVSLIFPVTDRGRRHIVALWGGTGFNFPHTAERFDLYAGSARRFAALAAAAGADVPLSNHPEIDGVARKAAVIRDRRASDPNPFVMGAPAVARFLTTVGECAQAYRAQLAG